MMSSLSKKAKGKVALNPGGGKGKLWTSKNVASDRVWLGYEWLRPVDKGEHHVPQDVSHAQSKALVEHRDHLSCSCHYLALLAHCATADQAVWLMKQKWGPVSVTDGFRLNREFAQRANVNIQLWSLSENEREVRIVPRHVLFARGPKASKDLWKVHLLFVPSPEDPDSVLHVLPLYKPDPKTVVTRLVAPRPTQVVVTPDASKAAPKAAPPEASSSNPVPPQPQPAAVQAAAAPPIMPEDLPRQTQPPVEAQQGFPLLGLLIPMGPELPHLALLGQVVGLQQGREDPGRGQDPAIEDPPLAQPPAPEDEGPLVAPQIPSVRYYGPFLPDENWRWYGGWWASATPAKFGIPMPSVMRMMEWTLNPFAPKPNLAAATLDCARKFGTKVLYLPYHPGASGPWPVAEGKRVVTDGVRKTSYFAEGDVVTLGSTEYSVVRTSMATPTGQLPVLQLVDSMNVWFDGVGRWIRRAAGLVLPVDCARVSSVALSGEPVVQSRDKASAQWIATVQTEKDPVKLAVLQRARQFAAASAYDREVCSGPEEVRRYVDALTDCYPKAVVSAGTIGCFSCGKGGPGTFPGKLCKSCGKGKNSVEGNLVAEGYKICSLAAPVQYPGVVNTATRHPPLKLGSETIATGRNFRSAPESRGGRRC